MIPRRSQGQTNGVRCADCSWGATEPYSPVPHARWASVRTVRVDYCVCKLGPKSPGPLGERVLFSVCSGSYLLAAAGVLDGLTATSHRLGLGALRQLGDEYKSRTPGAKGMEVVPENVTGTVHYVDAGMNASQVRIVTSGSITNGIDAALYLISLRSGRPDAVEVASFMGYTWREM